MIMINEKKVDRIVSKVIRESKKDLTGVWTGDIGPYRRGRDTMHGTYLRYTPEDSGFDSKEPWKRG